MICLLAVALYGGDGGGDDGGHGGRDDGGDGGGDGQREGGGCCRWPWHRGQVGPLRAGTSLLLYLLELIWITWPDQIFKPKIIVIVHQFKLEKIPENTRHGLDNDHDDDEMYNWQTKGNLKSDKVTRAHPWIFANMRKGEDYLIFKRYSSPPHIQPVSSCWPNSSIMVF